MRHDETKCGESTQLAFNYKKDHSSCCLEGKTPQTSRAPCWLFCCHGEGGPLSSDGIERKGGREG